MTESWRDDERAAYEAKADALEHASVTVRAIIPALDAIEAAIMSNAVAVLDRARVRNERAAALAKVEA